MLSSLHLALSYRLSHTILRDLEDYYISDYRMIWEPGQSNRGERAQHERFSMMPPLSHMVFKLSSFSPLSYVVGPGNVFSRVMWAFPSFPRTARGYTRCVGELSPSGAFPGATTLLHNLDARAAIAPFAQTPFVLTLVTALFLFPPHLFLYAHSRNFYYSFLLDLCSSLVL